jgi:hypothetical protein
LKRLDYVVVENPGPSRCDGAHRELFLARNSQLAGDDDIQRRVQNPGNLNGHRHTASWQGEHKQVRTAGVFAQPLGKLSAALGTILKWF